MANRKVSEATMLALRKEGLDNKEIARKLGISYTSVHRAIGQQPNRNISKQKISDEDLLAGHDLGLTAAQIAEEYNLDVSGVRRRLKKLLAASEATPRPEAKPEQLKFAQPEEKPVEPVSVTLKKNEPTPAPVVTPAPEPTHVQPVKNPTTVEPELFKFAFVPSYSEQINILSLLADPEPWEFADATENEGLYSKTTILESIVKETFKERAVEYNTCAPEERDQAILIRDKFSCFHTGLYTSDFQSIYAYFEPNRNPSGASPWYFIGFQPEGSPALQNIGPLPSARTCALPPFDATLPFRVNTTHIFKNPKTAERLPPFIRDYWNPVMLLETAVEYGRRKTRVEPASIVPCPRIGQPCYLMPLYVTQPYEPDIVAVVEPMDGYNLVKTCLTPKQAYLYARIHARPSVEWLRSLVTPKRTG